MTDSKQPIRSSPIFEALDEALDDSVDEATEEKLEEVVSLVWYGFESPESIDATIDEDAAGGDAFDTGKVKATAARELAKKRRAEAGWPRTTDCDRLDRAFVRLHELGICAVHLAGVTVQDGLSIVSDMLSDEDIPEDRYHGFCFYHSQDLDHALDGEDLLLAFGFVESDESPEQAQVEVGRLICEALRHEGLKVDWNGTVHERIALPQMQWQRRSPD